MNTDMLRDLTDSELDLASGAGRNIGGYTYCDAGPGKGAGLYVGNCGDSWQSIADKIKKAGDTIVKGAGGSPK